MPADQMHESAEYILSQTFAGQGKPPQAPLFVIQNLSAEHASLCRHMHALVGWLVKASADCVVLPDVWSPHPNQWLGV